MRKTIQIYSEIGKISGMLAQVETLVTPLIRQMDRFARWLTFVILLIAGVAGALVWKYVLEFSGDMYEVLPGMVAGFLTYVILVKVMPPAQAAKQQKPQ